MNSVNLIGNLASDVTLRGFKRNGEDREVANFLLAVNRRGKDAGADFVRVSVFNGSAKPCATYLSKGKKVAVEGELRSGEYERDGQTIRTIEVNARNVTFLSPRDSNGATAPTPSEEPAPGTDDDIPF